MDRNDQERERRGDLERDKDRGRYRSCLSIARPVPYLLGDLRRGGDVRKVPED